MNEGYIQNTLSIDKLLNVSSKVFESVSSVIDEQVKQGAGIAEITLGIADGIKTALCAYSMANVPQLNADTIILTATVWMKSDIESEIDYLENVLKSHQKKVFKEYNKEDDL